MLIYTGIGSRETPRDICNIMVGLGQDLSAKWLLRSGWAQGADQAFAQGAMAGKGQMVNYLPWEGFNGGLRNDERFRVLYSEDAMRIAAHFHPNWGACSSSAKLLHARNVYQVLGDDLNTPSQMVICWTLNGSGKGGTGQAIRIARGHGIPVFDLAIPVQQKALCDFVAAMEKAHAPAPKLDIQVVNKHHGAPGEYIGRGSPLGNPFPITDSEPREKVIAQYETWLMDKLNQGDPLVIQELDRLAYIAKAGPLRLQCFCAPKACHGDVIKRLITEVLENNT